MVGHGQRNAWDDARRALHQLADTWRRCARRWAAGREAQTLHRLLEFKPGDGGYGRNGERPLETDAVVVDETSMLDIVLCHHLLQAVPRHASVLFVGDADQLPSVGPGKFLGDVLESGVVPFLRLDRIFRQGERSGIVEAAHRVNRGRLPSSAPVILKGTSTSSKPRSRRRRPMPWSASARSVSRRGSDCAP